MYPEGGAGQAEERTIRPRRGEFGTELAFAKASQNNQEPFVVFPMAQDALSVIAPGQDMVVRTRSVYPQRSCHTHHCTAQCALVKAK